MGIVQWKKKSDYDLGMAPYHQDYYMFSRESQPKPLFATVTGKGPHPNYGTTLGLDVWV